MISITCTQCQTLLTIDDAFAGGACRCQHCGTIQTVPSRPKATATPQPYASPSSGKSKSLYQNEAARANLTPAAQTPSGLDDLANAVATSSGLSGSGLQGSGLKAAAAVTTRKPVAQPARAAVAAPSETEQPQRKKSPVLPIAIGAGALILALVGVIVFLLLHHGGPSSGGSSTGPGSGPGTTPTFCGEPIVGSSVVYVLDDANSIEANFDALKAATYASIASLGPDHKFAVVLWNNGSDFAFPTDGLAPATADQLDILRNKLQDTQATGATHIRSALTAALSRSPAAIVIVTAKDHLDDDDEPAVDSAKDSSGGKVKFYSFTVGTASENHFLKMTADATGGKYRNVSSQELRSASP
ncbi:MAG TPA: VWA domain-containing protein [Tepidisphaeraceae bacterium]|jgi:hypothetical protein|nr:VWA domain-containing protein [Tepidisphaeraceae bacterium]